MSVKPLEALRWGEPANFARVSVSWLPLAGIPYFQRRTAVRGGRGGAPPLREILERRQDVLKRLLRLVTPPLRLERRLAARREVRMLMQLLIPGRLAG